MPANFIKTDRNKELTRNLVRFGQMLKEAVQGLDTTRAAIIQTRDGDGTQAAHYDQTAAELGITAGDYADANAAAKAMFDELDSLYAKVGTDAATSNVRAAIFQFCAKLGIV